MDDYIRRRDAKTAIQNALYDGTGYGEALNAVPAAAVRPVVFCKDCIHRPYTVEPGKRFGFAVETPDRECKCPCYNSDDGWYSWIPDDDFFCGNGERRNEMGGVKRGTD